MTSAQELQFSAVTGAKKSATFLQKITKTESGVHNLGILNHSIDVNQLAAQGIQVTIRETLKAQGLNFKETIKKQIESGSESEGLEFVSTLRVKPKED